MPSSPISSAARISSTASLRAPMPSIRRSVVSPRHRTAPRTARASAFSCVPNGSSRPLRQAAKTSSRRAIVHDRFFGANREIELTVGQGEHQDRNRHARRHRARSCAARSGAVPTHALKEMAMKTKRWLRRGSGFGVRRRSCRSNRARFAGALQRREGTVRGGKKGRHGRELRYRPDLGELGSAVRGVQEALSGSRNRLQRPRVRARRSSRWTRRRIARRPTPRTISRPRRWTRSPKGVVAPFKPVNFDKLPPVFREPDGTLVHDSLADRRLRRQHQAGEERPAIVGRSPEARIQELDRLSRSALDRRRAGADVRRQFRRRRRHEQRPARTRLSRQAAQSPATCCA